jgi:CubicO group peptidase (beta-lactamase class C family)
MKHRGGIPQDQNFRAPDVNRIVGDAKTPQAIRARYVADILSRDPIAKPDTRFAYSNAGYAILSHIAERTAGVPYEELVRKSVLEPLGMTHSYCGSDTFPAARPTGHVPGPAGLRAMNMGGPLEAMVAGAGGGLYLSVGDLARFGEAHLKGLRGADGFLKADTVERLHSGVPEGGSNGMIYACGWGLHRHPSVESWHGHNGSNGTFRAEMAVFPKANMVVVAIVNRGGENDPSPGLEAVLALAGRHASKKKGGG